MSKKILNSILQHCDKEEILSKLCIGIPPKDIHEWLKGKYSELNETKFVISEKAIKTFQDNYLDMYNTIQEDLSKTKTAVALSSEDELALTVQNLPAYKNIMLKTANEELDIRKIIKTLAVSLETRFAQVFDAIQEDPRNINTRVDRLMIEYATVIGDILDKYYKFTETPDVNTVNHNVTIQVVDQHIAVFHDVIKEILSNIDLETSLYFLEVFNTKMSKLKAPDASAPVSADMRLAEAKVLNETINKKINE